ncbi:MocR-like pyridoxine biosynthesis transcription factor PdxR [Sphingobacterium suaedae]|uniref:PLP-dependent aminotransferase family protein n=1 Tax=Sphingobacterium suaedae TaxID=1686402 RepID=A0ABW5KCW5_9SPHI
MPSPVDIPFRSFIDIDRNAATPIFLQIVNQLIKAIQHNRIPPNAKLPGTRQLSQLLNVHRNTVVSSYDELAAQGWLIIRPNQGAFVISSIPTSRAKVHAQSHYPKETGFSFKRSILLDNPYDFGDYTYVFNDGTPDIRLTQINDLSRVYSAAMKRKMNRKKMGYYNHEGSEYFKEQLAHYIHLSRGLNITPSNLLITRSSEMSLFIISEILLRAGDIVAIGSPGYFSANMIFQKNRALLYVIPVDQEGIDTDALRRLCEKQKVRMVYITPQHHYPTTVSLSAPRRMALLQLADRYGFAIVEEDHDYDFHYDKQPLLPLATADTGGMVVYVGSFGKSLAPGFRTGFIVAPDNLMQEMRKHLGIIDRQGDVLMEHALGEMIEEGVIHRHLKRSLKIYKERRNKIINLLDGKCSSWLSAEKPSGGLAVWATFHSPINLAKLAQHSAENQLFIPRNILYQQKGLTAMRIGFGHMNEEELEQSLRLFCETIKQLG